MIYEVKISSACSKRIPKSGLPKSGFYLNTSRFGWNPETGWIQEKKKPGYFSSKILSIVLQILLNTFLKVYGPKIVELKILCTMLWKAMYEGEFCCFCDSICILRCLAHSNLNQEWVQEKFRDAWRSIFDGTYGGLLWSGLPS